MAEHSYSISVTSHHHVAESNVIVGGEMCGHHAGEHGFLVQFDVIQRFQR